MNKIQTKNKYLYILVSLMVLFIMPVYFFGTRIIALALVGIFTALVCDFCFMKFFKYQSEKGDISSIISALIIVLLMPATVPYTTIIIGVVVALGIGKYPFGGTKNNLFNPAAVGVCVLALSFPKQVFKFPVPKQELGLGNFIFENTDIIFKDTPASIMNVGGTPQMSVMQLLFGNFTGAIGVTAILVLGVILLFLCATRIISFNIVFGGLVTVVLYAMLFPRVSTGIEYSIVYELSSGMLLFGFIFMASDPSTSPKTKIGRLLYGITLALVTMIFRTIGALDVEFVFVLLIMNAVYKEFDRISITMKKTKVDSKKESTALSQSELK